MGRSVFLSFLFVVMGAITAISFLFLNFLLLLLPGPSSSHPLCIDSSEFCPVVSNHFSLDL